MFLLFSPWLFLGTGAAFLVHFWEKVLSPKIITVFSMNNCETLPGSLVFYLSGLRNAFWGNFLIIQWLGLQAGSILGWRTKIIQVMWFRQKYLLKK